MLSNITILRTCSVLVLDDLSIYCETQVEITHFKFHTFLVSFCLFVYFKVKINVLLPSVLFTFFSTRTKWKSL